MAFNKNKALETALKFLNQGKTAQAIGEYQQILRNDPKDQATLMTVGDLFARQADMPQAIEYFERLAQVYLHDGFNSKAIAIYKKIAKLAPAELAPLERLADLYVQQGVLSEARPLFLQIAEAHLKANRAPKAVEILHRFLEVEPDNPRVQMRLAELYNVMGQKKEAAQTYLSYSQRLFDNGEVDEAGKMIERALAVDPGSTSALLLQAKILAQANKNDAAIAILERLPEADAGGEITNLLIDLEISSGHVSKAADRARKQLARSGTHTALLEKVSDALLQAGKAAEALPLIRELRGPMIEASEQDRFLKLLSSSIEKLPDEVEPLEMLADFARHTSDPFQLNAALTKLADIYADTGNYTRAEEMLQELVERNKGDERLIARLEKLRSHGEQLSPRDQAPAQLLAESEPSNDIFSTRDRLGEALLFDASDQPAVPKAEESLDEETQRYIAQALTDVDLFSSYGLTQKATNLLENVLKRAPRHTPTLERLLDLYLGASDEQRTVELASQLEQIHAERGDTINSDRFKELRQRFQKAAGLSEGLPIEQPPTAPLSVSSSMHSETSGSHTPTAEAPALANAVTPDEPVEFEIRPLPAEADSFPPAIPPNPTELTASPAQEVDLSDEWEAMVQEVGEEAPLAKKGTAAPPPTSELSAEAKIGSTEPIPGVQPTEPLAAEANAADDFAERTNAEARAAERVTEGAEFELELAPEPEKSKTNSTTTEDFLSDLASEVEDMEIPLQAPEVAAIPATAPTPAQPAEAGAITAQTLNELTEVFQEFRNELGELGEEGEDLETHYNLGIAYREMGLLDEAIGEFQKVAKAVKEGKTFRYAMNCAALLAISFMDKGEPRIAAMWYQEALELPGLEQETIIALRYDLGVSLDMAGEADAALDNFRQVYAMNIDYRDVSDRIATLQKR
ncbi:MAG TPA: tetratricopeptide repeat protein [Candidatus Acidoferrales bacterium]|nr:tetratricopeptide repeat protein [Candidatus Acidoferrales bacterium]